MPKRVLYADDEPGLRRLVERGLGAQGIAVVTVEDGLAAVERLQQEEFDVVALDHHMPRLDGMGALTRIQQMPNHPPVIIVTSEQDSAVAVAALKAGAFDYVLKDASGEFVPLLLAALTGAANAMRLRRAKETAEAELREQRDRFEQLAAERAMLLREVNHRVGNSLQTDRSLSSIAGGIVAERAGQGRAHRRDPARDGGRAGAQAALHLRRRAVGVGRSVSGRAGGRYRQDRRLGTPILSLAAEPIGIDPDRAVAIGMIVNELVLNAMKYAYPDAKGPIRIGLKRLNGKRAMLSVEDDGIGHDIKTLPRSTGLGRSIVGAMASRLGADVVYDPAHRGTRIVITFECSAPPAD